MTRKTRNSIIIYGIALSILGLITVSVWYDMETSLHTKGKGKRYSPVRKNMHPDSNSGAPLSRVGVVLSFVSDPPSEITASTIPDLQVTISNASGQTVYVRLESIQLKKHDFSSAERSIPVVCRTSQVNPRRIDRSQGQADASVLKPGGKRTLIYSLGDYFNIFPGIFDIEAIITKGGAESQGKTNKKAIRGIKRITVSKGFSPARFFSEEGVSGLQKAAAVNGKPIYEHELTEQLISLYGYTMLKKLIAERCVWDVLRKNGVKVNQNDIDYAVSFEKRTMKEKLKGVPFEKYLESKGMSEEELRESRGFLLRIAVRKFLSSRAVPPSRKELLAFFNRRYSWYGRREMVQVKKIVAAPVPEKGKTVSPNDKERAIAKLLAVKEEIEKGGISFDEAVTLYSQDVRARVSGGLMEPFSTYRSAERSSVPEAVADAAFRLKPGEISTPIETEEGYVILQAVRRIPPKKVLFNDVKETVQRDYLYDSVTGTEIQKWITGLVNSARIEIDAGVLTQFASWGRPGKLKHFETDLIKED